MTDKELSTIKARADAASPRPWRVGRDMSSDWLIGSFLTGADGKHDWYVLTRDIRCSEMITGGAEHDAEFIAHARSDVPALLAEVERLQRELAATRNLCGIPSEDA